MSAEDDLRREIAEGRVVCVVGAGVTIAATGQGDRLRWSGVLTSLVERASEAGIPPRLLAWLQQGIETEDLEAGLMVAERATTHLGGRASPPFSQWLQQFGALRIVHDAVPSALAAFRAPLVTTNYDDILEHATGRSAATPRDASRVQAVLDGSDPNHVVHLHGHWRTPESVVLGVRSYEEALGNDTLQAVQHAFWQTKTLLFVGFGAGLVDPNFAPLAAWGARVLKATPHVHYRLMLEGDFRRDPPDPKLGIRVLRYADHGDLPALLARLAPPAMIPTAPPTPSGPTATWKLPGRPPLVIGRHDEVDRIAQTLATNRGCMVVLGESGMGKSTVAQEALYDERVVRRHGARRAFVRLDSMRTANDVAREIARTCDVMLPDGPVDIGALGVALATPVVALVLDNLETAWTADTERVESLLRELSEVSGVSFVATVAGNKAPHGKFERLVVRELSATDQQALATTTAQRDLRPSAQARLARLSEGNTFALLVLARALDEIDESAVEAAWRRGKLALGDRHTSVFAAFEVAWERLAVAPNARELLQLLAAFDAGLPEEIAEDVLGADFEFERARAALRRVGLLADAGGWARLRAPVVAWVALAHPPENAASMLGEQSRRHFEDWLQPALRATTEATSAAGRRRHTSLVLGFWSLVGLWEKRGVRTRFEALLAETPPDDPQHAQLLTDYAVGLRDNGAWTDAAALFLRAIRLKEQGGASKSSIAITLHEYARGLRDNGPWTDAAPLFLRAIQLEQEGGGSKFSIAITLGEYARGLRDNGAWTDAAPVFLRAIQFKEQGGASKTSLAITLHCYACGLRDNGAWSDAAPIFLRAIQLCEQGGASKTNLATTLHDYARGLRDNGAWSVAAPLFLRAMQLDEEGGASKASCAITLYSYARGLGDNGAWALAAPLFLRAIQLDEEGGASNTSRAATLNAYAQGLTRNGDKSGAVTYFKQALALAPPGSPEASAIERELADLVSADGATADQASSSPQG